MSVTPGNVVHGDLAATGWVGADDVAFLYGVRFLLQHRGDLESQLFQGLAGLRLRLPIDIGEGDSEPPRVSRRPGGVCLARVG